MRKVTIGIGESATPTEHAVAAVLVRKLEEMSGGQVQASVVQEADPAILIGTPSTSEPVAQALGEERKALDELGPEGFLITRNGETVVVVSQRVEALIFGAGRLLRESSFEAGQWSPPSQIIVDHPKLPVRTIYFADHMGNWYSHATDEEVREYLEEMALWGYNEVMTVLAVRPGETFFDSVARLHSLEDHARLLGLRAGTVVQSNTSFDKPRDEWRATPGPIPGAYDVNPSKPGAWNFLVDDKRQYLEIMQPYDFICLWPYDGGGCYCSDCAPWGGTFLRLSEDIAKEAIGDASEVRVSAWFFERDVEGDDEALFAYLAGHPSWFRYIVAGAVEARRWIADGRTIPEEYGVLIFPDISMFDGIPWGGRGANAAPRRFADELKDTLPILKGGIVYSEGRYDDINKILWARMLWDPDIDPTDAVRDYANFYFGGEADAVAEMIDVVEKGMEMLPDGERWRREIFHPEWDRYAVVIERALPQRIIEGWRWRMLRSKTKIEATYHAAVLGPAEGRESSLKELRETYNDLQDSLNLHDPERSLLTWIYAPLEEAFPQVVEPAS